MFIFAFLADEKLLSNREERLFLQSMIANLFHLFEEITTRKARTEEDIAIIEQRLAVFANHAEKLQTKLKDAETGNRGFETEKMHKFFQLGQALKMIGPVQQASSQHFEESNLNLKNAVQHLNSNKAVLVRALENTNTHAVLVGQEPIITSTTSGLTLLQKRRLACQSTALRICGDLQDSSYWSEIASCLTLGDSGTSFDDGTVSQFPLVIEALVNREFHNEESCPSRRITIAAKVKEKGKTNADHGRFLVPAQCYIRDEDECGNGGYVQYICSVIVGRVIKVVVVDFEPVSYSDDGLFPEVPQLPWLVRSYSVSLINVNDIGERVHIVELNGHACRQEGDESKHYVVNTALITQTKEKIAPVIYRSCADKRCEGKVKLPLSKGENGMKVKQSRADIMVTCPKCKVNFLGL
mmetsp:Transcript_54818/g.74930  ORF Transcript_54818/g.74930 Transcript_54818/m.74930 type:complete len:411 (-) Transcript_54818:534-1766(-)